MSKAYLIDAVSRNVTAVDAGRDTMRKHLPGGICIGTVYGNGDVLYVDEEGLLHPAAKAFRIKSRPDGQPMMSDGLLYGREHPETGEPFDPASTPEDVEADIEWLTVEEAMAWFREKATQPAVTGTRGGTTEVYARWSDFVKNLEGEKGYDPNNPDMIEKMMR